jgi:UDP-N-acetylmuramoyl-tripeptide--D-alanyl-D-alanine ligase
MKPVLLSQLAQWCGGRLHGADLPVHAVGIDSRELAPGSLFVALRGERVDGHDFVAAAANAGAVAALVERPLAVELPQLVVADPVAALGAIATGIRAGRDTTVLALTGSNGKTSVKTLTAAMLSRVAPTYANPGNRNNEIGMPLALIEQPEDVRFAIYEMGAGQPGDIDHLAAIARPQVSLVNNIGPAHLERMGSLLGIAETKGAIHARLPVDGTAVINADDAFGRWFEGRLPDCGVLRFGIDASAELRAVDWRPRADGSDFRLLTPAGEAAVRLPLPGRHNLLNALAAASMATAVDAPLADIVTALEAARPVAGRLASHRLASGALLIDDAYNANPQSVAAAIAVLAGQGGETWLVLGDMRELGPEALALHAEVGRQAREAGIGRLWTVGELSAAAAEAFGAEGRHFASQPALIEALREAIHGQVRCLVKGSRGSRMERVIEALRGPLEGEGGNAA